MQVVKLLCKSQNFCKERLNEDFTWNFHFNGFIGFDLQFPTVKYVTDGATVLLWPLVLFAEPLLKRNCLVQQIFILKWLAAWVEVRKTNSQSKRAVKAFCLHYLQAGVNFLTTFQLFSL